MRALLTACLLLATAAGAAAHGLDLHAESGPAWTVTAVYADGSPCAFERFEVFRPDDPTPYQIGRTDRSGRAVFRPDAPGRWRVRLVSEDGHGGELAVDVDAVAAAAAPRPSRGRDLVTGVAVLFGLFGIVSLFKRRN